MAETKSNPCNEVTHNLRCPLPRWRDGIDPGKCVGHQPMQIQDMIQHPTTGEIIPVMDPATDEDLICWVCAATPPMAMCLVDHTMPGEVWCYQCIANHAEDPKLKIRLDDEGDNY